LNGRRSITADTAVRLGRYFGNSAQFWLDLQGQYDIAEVEREHGVEITRRVRPADAASASGEDRGASSIGQTVEDRTRSATRGVPSHQIWISFIDLDELSEIIDAVVREGRYCLFTGAEDGEAAVFGVHFDGDFLQPVLVLAEHLGDASDGEDVTYPGHGQAA
jgi:hypothetical protein